MFGSTFIRQECASSPHQNMLCGLESKSKSKSKYTRSPILNFTRVIEMDISMIFTSCMINLLQPATHLEGDTLKPLLWHPSTSVALLKIAYMCNQNDS